MQLGEKIMKASRILSIALALSVVCLSTPVPATSFTTDQSDLWWNANEPGWGIQMVQRDQAIFATIYVYYTDDTPYWYTSLMTYQGNYVWSGALNLSNGSWFGAIPYSVPAFSTQTVGTMTWTATFVESGTLTYTVNGVQVTKNLTRFHLASDNYNGTFFGGLHTDVTGCSNTANNISHQEFVDLAVAQTGSSFQMTLSDASTVTCTFPGSITQSGQFGIVNGQFSCTDGSAGSFRFFEMVVGINTVSGRVSTSNPANGCNATGYFGGIRSR
jgi:hypothetical protein